MDSYREEIREQLMSLTDINKILFATITCERLYPNYKYFQQQVGWGNHEILQEAIILLYQPVVSGGDVNINEVNEAVSQVDMITPDTDEFPGITTSFALDACTSIYSTLMFLLDRNIENIVDVATYARDTVDMFIQERDNMDYNNDPAFELKISNDNLMITEKNRQKVLVAKLRDFNGKKITTADVDRLREQRPIIDIDSL